MGALTENAFPFPCDLHRVRDIGVWFDVMQVMVFAAVLTNCFILGFSSEQLMQWTPWLYSREAAGGDQVMATGSGRCVARMYSHVLSYCYLLSEYNYHELTQS